ncbi:MAG: NAD(P)H-hydrate dehydratase [Aphanocapsa sp. GSE-SYN-MK-11-07L]|jgi:NAD(P)H-hydrate epimerase|nr:NAD(P)H-hydrate dehydratase [Aphanocapsa sp. GSE-SYN-MK-11-07L]
MRQIEERVFAAGMPIAALMEKVGIRIAQRVQQLYPRSKSLNWGVLVGPGHNGADALVVARELHCQGYPVQIYHPFQHRKDLTDQHRQFAAHLGIAVVNQVSDLQACDVVLDGLFGFGLEKPPIGEIAAAIAQINTWQKPTISIDLPSGLHTDTGEALGTAIQATHTLCLGLWKLGLLQDQALTYVGQVERLDLDLPVADISSVLAASPRQIGRMTRAMAIAGLPLPRPLAIHKYQQGHLLLVGGSRRYPGSILLAGLAARATGIGMLSIAVPESLKLLVLAQLPEALVIGCPESDEGAIADLPLDLASFDAIACGPGLTTANPQLVEQVLACDRPLVLDADGLNLLASLGTVPKLQQRTAPTVLTPHPGEFKRLFPDLGGQTDNRAIAAHLAAQQTGAIVLLKGARVALADPNQQVWLNPESTPALARGGSGDVLTGLIGGLLAPCKSAEQVVAGVRSAVWWHAQAGIYGVNQNTELGVDAFTLTQFLTPTLKAALASSTPAYA